MKYPKLKKVNLVVLILAVTAFLMAVTSFLVKDFRYGETDFSILFGMLLVPAIVIIVLKLNQPKKN